MRESGESPEHCPLPYALEAVVRDVSRSLGKPEKANDRREGFQVRLRMARAEDL
jgi:hypothetical protein